MSPAPADGSDPRATEPPASSALERLPIGGALTDPGDHPVRPDEHGTRSEVVARRATGVPDQALPPHRRVAQATVGAEIQHDASAVPHQVAETGAVLEAEVRRAAPDQRVLAAQVVADRGARRPLE